MAYEIVGTNLSQVTCWLIRKGNISHIHASLLKAGPRFHIGPWAIQYYSIAMLIFKHFYLPKKILYFNIFCFFLHVSISCPSPTCWCTARMGHKCREVGRHLLDRYVLLNKLPYGVFIFVEFLMHIPSLFHFDALVFSL